MATVEPEWDSYEGMRAEVHALVTGKSRKSVSKVMEQIHAYADRRAKRIAGTILAARDAVAQRVPEPASPTDKEG
jgi:hypothetical protein